MVCLPEFFWLGWNRCQMMNQYYPEGETRWASENEVCASLQHVCARLFLTAPDGGATLLSPCPFLRVVIGRAHVGLVIKALQRCDCPSHTLGCTCGPSWAIVLQDSRNYFAVSGLSQITFVTFSLHLNCWSWFCCFGDHEFWRELSLVPTSVSVWNRSCLDVLMRQLEW